MVTLNSCDSDSSSVKSPKPTFEFGVTQTPTSIEVGDEFTLNGTQKLIINETITPAEEGGEETVENTINWDGEEFNYSHFDISGARIVLRGVEPLELKSDELFAEIIDTEFQSNTEFKNAIINASKNNIKFNNQLLSPFVSNLNKQLSSPGLQFLTSPDTGEVLFIHRSDFDFHVIPDTGLNGTYTKVSTGFVIEFRKANEEEQIAYRIPANAYVPTLSSNIESIVLEPNVFTWNPTTTSLIEEEEIIEEGNL